MATPDVPQSMARSEDSKPFVLFDLGQTIVDLRGLVHALSSTLAREYPALSSESDDLAKEWMRRSAATLPRRETDSFVPEFAVVTAVLVELLDDQAIALSPEGARALLRRAWDQFETTANFCPGVSRLWLGEVRQRARRMALVTDGDDENIERLVRQLGLTPFFDVIVTSEAAHAYKPNHRIYDAALAALPADPADSVFVSDAAIDLQGAHALGMRTVLLGSTFVTEPKDLPPGSVRIEQPNDLIPYLDGLREPRNARTSR
jgi:2-haloalkanoic acid dehalogenase type II